MVAAHRDAISGGGDAPSPWHKTIVHPAIHFASFAPQPD
jgi:hypothetical protein